MRTLVIGDVHGCLRALDALLRAVQPAPDDLLVTLGDYVDAGPDSAGVLDRLIALGQAHQLVALRGNHEELMLAARAGGADLDWWRELGGRATLRSYPGGTLAGVPPAHWRFLQQTCVDHYETATHIFVHASVDPDLPLAQQPLRYLHWHIPDVRTPHVSGKVVVCGHVVQRTGVPRNFGHTLSLDTGMGHGGWLTALDLGSGKIWQTNERGQAHRLHLGDVE